MIGIIDYRMGNLRSVQKAFERVGAAAVVLSSPDEGAKMDRLVLPGVGAFADGMHYLGKLGWTDAIARFIEAGKPFLGICLGMQLLFGGSQEDAPSGGELVPGLGILPGRVVRFAGDAYGPGKLKVPHMGWNTLQWQRDDPLMQGLGEDPAVYFVHGCYAEPDETRGETVTCTTADYGRRFSASLWADNIWATQFHPEKSQQVGLQMLKNFASL